MCVISSFYIYWIYLFCQQGSLYYPDWINDSQVCLNDGEDPEYMLKVQRENYLYRSKEECCESELAMYDKSHLLCTLSYISF